MIEQSIERDAVSVIAFAPSFDRSDARSLLRCVRDGAAAGEQRFVVDLMRARYVNEGSLCLALLGLRSDLRRRSGRLVIAADRGLALRLARSLRLDEVVDAASSLEDALSRVLPPSSDQPLDDACLTSMRS